MSGQKILNQLKGGAGLIFEQIVTGVLKHMGTGSGESVFKFVKEMNIKNEIPGTP
jgi:hypothetical protein